ncbi:MAG: FAD-dependent oxidoreductase, partial [Candidatus Sumerlaeota bacterium]|nr:FAD-dependent oxidoreductase [Candidatus Sumerlaeota bacterium]
MIDKKESIAILGAGLAGLSCAFRLTELGYENITILEKEPEAGGLAVSVHYKGHVSDLGPHRIHSEIPRVRNFLNDCAGNLIVKRQRNSHMMLDGGMLPYPPRFFTTVGHFGAAKMAGFLGSYIWTRFAHFISPPPEETFETVMEMAFGRALCRAIIKPYTEKTWKMKTDELSPEVAGARVSAGGLSALARRLFLREKRGMETSLDEFLYTRGGIGKLASVLEEKLANLGVHFLFNAEVTGLEAGRERAWRICYRREGGEIFREADLCFSTIPITDLMGYLLKRSPDERVAQSLSSLGFLAMVLVFVRVKRPHISHDTWLYFPDSELIFNRGYEAKNFDESMGPADESIICLEITARTGDSLWRLPDEYFQKRAVDDLTCTGIVSKNEILDAHVRRITHAYPIYHRQYRRALEDVYSYLMRRPALITLGRQGLFHHNNMDHSIYEGLLAAEYAAEKENACAAWY